MILTLEDKDPRRIFEGEALMRRMNRDLYLGLFSRSALCNVLYLGSPHLQATSAHLFPPETSCSPHLTGDWNDCSSFQALGLIKMKTGCVALFLCLNISVDPPDVIKISPCARMECWIDPFSMAPQKALETIGKTLSFQYERWQPKAKYKIQLDPTVEEVKKLCTTCRKYAKSERVLFHYNGHGVPKPTANGEIWFFNSGLDSWLKTPSIFANAFIELLDWTRSSSSSGTSPRECILLAACEAHETLPQSHEFPADVFTSCLTTPIKIALRWFCTR
ncbi:unnamed protein product [Lactuca virosa]|uniref:Raptor N-terminal CASPase-like domain-containing protein n=1 Tax=Lactuca virosa TaxID=75947 RepID=A0AAU9NCJ7_9ASTR|nr:unnamed protein product [Lactuca virosa]